MIDHKNLIKQNNYFPICITNSIVVYLKRYNEENYNLFIQFHDL